MNKKKYSTLLKKKNDLLQENNNLLAKKIGLIQGICECVAAIGDDYTFAKKLLSKTKITKDIAKKYASPETFEKLEKGIFAQKPEQKLEQTHGMKR